MAPEFGTTTIADGIAVKEPGKLTLPIVRDLVSAILLVEEGDIEQAIVLLLEIEKTVVEGAGAAGLAALLAHRQRFRGRKVGLVLCGGNIDPLMLADIIERGMVRTGRLTRLTVELRDLPGALAKVTACLAEQNANIEEIASSARLHQPAGAERRGGLRAGDARPRARAAGARGAGGRGVRGSAA